MVRLIYITSQKHFIPPISSYSTNNKYNAFEYCLTDWTSNFTNLLYWNTELDLNNRTLKEVLHKLSVAISRLERENIKPQQYEDGFILPKWWFGRKRISENNCCTEEMPDEERKSILLLHLLNMYDELIKLNKKNKTYYCYAYN